MVKRNHTAPVLVAPAPHFATQWVGASCLLLGVVWASPAAAQDPAPKEQSMPHENSRAMPGLVHVGLPLPTHAPLVFAATGGYGYIDPALDLLGSAHRLQGGISGAFSVLPFLVLGADASGRLDLFKADDDPDGVNMYGEPRVTARFHQAATDSLFWGVELDVRLIGEKAPDVDLSATSPSLRAQLASKLGPATWLGAEVGFHLDKSAHSLPDPIGISSADRVTVGASSSSAIPFGLGVSHRLPAGTELLGEISGEFLVGAAAPPLMESPWGLSLGARHPVNDAIDVMLSADVSFSARGSWDQEAYVPVAPRAAGLITAIWHWGVPAKPEVVAVQEEKPPEPKKPKVEEKPPEPVIETTPVTGTVVDEGGRPLADVQVVLTQGDGEPIEERTFANGTFEFKGIPDGPVTLVITTPGFDKITTEFKEGEERSREIVMYPALPAGQVKGAVRDLRGNPLAVKMTITPGDKTIEIGADGKFELELAPGKYTVRFEHPELSPQKRFIRVQDRGVVILNIALAP